MNANKKFLIGMVAAAVLIFAAFALWNRPEEKTPSGGGAVTDTSRLIREHSPTKGGPATAPVTIVEFMDPECEACAAMHPIVKSLLGEYGDRVRLVIRYLTFHGNSLYAAALLEEARESGKFEQALDVFSERLPEWGDHHAPRPERLAVYMTDLGIDKMRTEKDYVIRKHEAKIKIDAEDGDQLGVQRTPTFFVNGQIQGQIGYEPLKAAIEQALAAQ